MGICKKLTAKFKGKFGISEDLFGSLWISLGSLWDLFGISWRMFDDNDDEFSS